MSSIRLEAEGLPELIRALRNNANLSQPLNKAFHAIGLKGVSDSRRKAPVNSGKLRNSIFYEVDFAPLPTYVKIGVLGGEAANYAAFMEYGTGSVNDHPNWPKEPHAPPAAALEAWVAQKGRVRGERAAARRARLSRVEADARRVAFFIARRGGLRPRRYLRDPFEANAPRYVRLITQAMRQMSLDG